MATEIDLGTILAHCLVADNEVRRSAEAALKQAVANPSCIGALLQQLQQSPHPEIRQLAALVIRRRINSHWKNFDPNAQGNIKQMLLTCLVNETQRLVQQSIAMVLVALAKGMNGQWPELWSNLSQLALHQSDSVREGAVNTFRLLLSDDVGGVLENSLKDVHQLMVHALQDRNLNVQQHALHGIGSMVDWLGDTQDLKIISNTIPLMV
jgi:methionyl-tRNA formyltransferase